MYFKYNQQQKRIEFRTLARRIAIELSASARLTFFSSLHKQYFFSAIKRPQSTDNLPHAAALIAVSLNNQAAK